jgi:hypothetical protein
LEGNSQTIGSFETTMRILLDLLGHEIVWEMEQELEPEHVEKRGDQLIRPMNEQCELRKEADRHVFCIKQF